MSVTANTDGVFTVGYTVTANGQADGAETLTGYQWQSAVQEGAAWSNVSGATSQTLAIAESLRCKWLRVQIAFDDGGNTVYAYSTGRKVGPCGGGHGNKGKAAAAKAATPAASETKAADVAEQPRKGLRRIYKVDTSKWLEARRPR